MKIDRNVRTGLTKCFGNGAANPAARSRDKRYFVRQLHEFNHIGCKEPRLMATCSRYPVARVEVFERPGRDSFQALQSPPALVSPISGPAPRMRPFECPGWACPIRAEALRCRLVSIEHRRVIEP